jgi:hypothetical protein
MMSSSIPGYICERLLDWLMSSSIPGYICERLLDWLIVVV